MGKKYIIEIPDDKIGDFIGSTHFLMPYMMAGHIGHHDTGLPIEPYTEPDLEQVKADAYNDGYKAGREAERVRQPDLERVRLEAEQLGLVRAWGAAREIIHMPEGDLLNIFTECYSAVCTALQVILKYDAAEAVEKVRQYEQKQDAEIKVGDEVIPRETEYDTMIVTRLWKDDYDSDCIDAIGFDGRISSFLVSRVSKTGNHYEIAAVLEKMRGEQE